MLPCMFSISTEFYVHFKESVALLDRNGPSGVPRTCPKSYTLINDLSHGGWRSEQSPITEDDYKDVCETIIKHIENDFKGQIEYCEKFNAN